MICHPTPEELLQKFQLDNLPADRCVFWSHGGSISDGDERRNWSINEELQKAFIQRQAFEQGFSSSATCYIMQDGITRPPDGCYIGLTDALGCYDGKTKHLMSSLIAEVSFWANKKFWRDISERFAQKAEGLISVAVDGASANTNFRLFEHAEIMANDKITSVRIIEGYAPPPQALAYVDSLTRKFNVVADYDAWDEIEKDLGPERMHMIHTSMMYKDDLQVIPKAAWDTAQKQKWFDTSIEKILNHLKDLPQVKGFEVSDMRHHYNPDDECIFRAKARFLCEVTLCLREAAKLERRLQDGDTSAQDPLRQEKKRLEECLSIMKTYPEVLYFDEPHTALEQKRARFLKFGNTRIKAVTQEFGYMLMRLDDTLSTPEKDKIWGKHMSYNFTLPSAASRYLGQPEAVENYVRAKIATLESDVKKALEAKPEIILTNNEDEVRELVKAGYCPVECSINGHSIVDDLVMDHHEDRSHLEPVSVRALRDHAGAKSHDPRFVVVGACDADAAFAIAALSGLIPVNAATMKLGETIGIMDTTPVGRDILKLPYGAYLATWEDSNSRTNRKPEGAYKAVADWVNISAGLDTPNAALQERLDQAIAKESNRHQTALDDLARSTVAGQVRLINHSEVFGFSEWHGRLESADANACAGWDIPVVVIYNRHSNTIGISCPNKSVAEEVFGKGGLRNVFDKLEGKNGKSFGGRESVGGSPRGETMSFEDAQKVQQKIAGILDGLQTKPQAKRAPQHKNG